jgi:hypothetical protein
MLTAEQRYKQATVKARILAQRQLRQFMAGEIDVLPCSGDQEREFIIAEIRRLVPAQKRTGWSWWGWR